MNKSVLGLDFEFLSYMYIYSIYSIWPNVMIMELFILEVFATRNASRFGSMLTLYYSY